MNQAAKIDKHRLGAGTVLMKGVLPTAGPFIGVATLYFYYLLSSLFVSLEHKSAFKCIPIVLLAIIVLYRGTSSGYKYLVFLGLVLSAVGDYYLVFPDKFLEGTAAFGSAHLMYVLAFGFSPFGFLSMLVGFTLATTVSYHLVPTVPEDLRMAVPCYIALIGCMLWRSLARLGHHQVNWTHYAGALGAVLFCCSDLNLSFNEWYFEKPCQHAELITMLTYYGGQLGIALSAMDRRGMAEGEIKTLAAKARKED